MKKFKLGIASSALLLAVGGVSAAIASGEDLLFTQALDVVDCGDQCLYINENLNGSVGGLYLLANVDNTLPFNPDWSLSYTPVGAGAVMVNGVDKTGNGPLLQKLGNNSYYFNHAGSATTGDVVTISGDWHYSDGTNDYVFTVYPALSIKYVDDTTKWDYELEDHQVVSLDDLCIADVEFEPIDTEGYGVNGYDLYHYVYFDQSKEDFSFKFELEAAADHNASDFKILLGGKDANWGGDHDIELTFHGDWGSNGVFQLWEYVGGAPTELAICGEDSDMDVRAGVTHIFEFGFSKVKNSTAHLVYLNRDDVRIAGAVLELNSRPFANRIGIYTGSSNYAFRTVNEKIYGEESLMPAQLPYFTTSTDLIPAISNWSDWAIPCFKDNITLNGDPLQVGINQIKKTESTEFYFDCLSSLDEGDVVTIGGPFKFVVHDTFEMYTISFKKETYVYNGTKLILKSDIDAAEVVDAKIEAIGTVSLDSETAITAARTAYDELSADGKSCVTKLSVLEAAEARLAELKTAKAAAEAVDNQIDSIGVVTLQCEALINTCRNAYEALTADGKAFVTKLEVLEDAETRLAELKANKAAADAVDAKIESIGTVSLSSEDAISEARAAYDALNEEAKGFVTKLNVLQDAEAELARLKGLKAEAEAVDAIIDTIVDINRRNYEEEKAKVDAARAAYDALSEEAKGFVTELRLLQGAEGRIRDIEAAIAVDELIDAIGEVTLEKEQQITAARTAYDTLNANQNRFVLHLDVLQAAEARLAELKELAAYKVEKKNYIDATVEQILPNYRQAQQQIITAGAAQAKTAIDAAESKAEIDQILAGLQQQLAQIPTAAQLDAKDVDDQINALPAVANIALTDEDAIVAARAAYTALSSDAKQYVTKLSVLEAAEARLAELKANIAAAEEVEELIDNIGEINVLRECREKIEAARTAYDALSEEAKAMVTNYGTLTAAEARFDELLATAKEDGKAMVDNIYASINLKKYSKDNQDVIAQLVEEAKAAIDEAEDNESIEAVIQAFEADLADIPVKKAANKGCGGSVIATSVVLSTLALAGIGLLSIKKRKED